MQVDVVGLNCATGPVEMSEALRHLSGASRVPIVVPPERGAPFGGRRQDALRPHTRGPGRAPAPLRHRVRRLRRRRLLRHHAGPPGRGGRALRRRHARGAHAGARAGGRVHLHLGALQAGHLVPGGRRAHQRQRVQGVPRGHARGRLGHLRGHGAGPGEGGLAPDRRLRGLHRRRRRRRHDRGGQPALHAVDRAAHGRLHRGPGRACRAGVDRRPADPQLGEPRGGRRAGDPARHVPAPGPRVRGRRRVHLHRRGGPGPHGRVEAARRPQHPRHRRRALRAGARGPPVRRPGPPAVDRAWRRAGSTASRRSRGSGRSRPNCPGVSTILGLSNVSFGLNPAARQVLNSVFLHECVEAGLDAAIVHASKILPLSRIEERAKEVCLDLVYDRRTDDYDPLQELLAPLRGGQGQHGRGGRPRRLARRPAAEPAHHRRQPQRARGRPRRGARVGARRARHRQRHLAGRHEGGRRALRLRRDAAALRAPVGRDDEDGRRLPRAAHGEDGPGRQGHRRAGHGQGRRARHRQEPGRHHPDQQRLHRGEPRHQGRHQRDDRARSRSTRPTPSA